MRFCSSIEIIFKTISTNRIHWTLHFYVSKLKLVETSLFKTEHWVGYQVYIILVILLIVNDKISRCLFIHHFCLFCSLIFQQKKEIWHNSVSTMFQLQINNFMFHLVGEAKRDRERPVTWLFFEKKLHNVLTSCRRIILYLVESQAMINGPWKQKESSATATHTSFICIVTNKKQRWNSVIIRYFFYFYSIFYCYTFWLYKTYQVMHISIIYNEHCTRWIQIFNKIIIRSELTRSKWIIICNPWKT